MSGASFTLGRGRRASGREDEARGAQGAGGGTAGGLRGWEARDRGAGGASDRGAIRERVPGSSRARPSASGGGRGEGGFGFFVDRSIAEGWHASRLVRGKGDAHAPVLFAHASHAHVGDGPDRARAARCVRRRGVHARSDDAEATAPASIDRPRRSRASPLSERIFSTTETARPPRRVRRARRSSGDARVNRVRVRVHEPRGLRATRAVRLVRAWSTAEPRVLCPEEILYSCTRPWGGWGGTARSARRGVTPTRTYGGQSERSPG